jgi:hypothetical protein
MSLPSELSLVDADLRDEQRQLSGFQVLAILVEGAVHRP